MPRFIKLPLPNRNNQANDGRQAQAQDPDILELILQEIAAGFKEVTVEVTAATRPPVSFDHAADANNWSPERKIKIASGYLCGIATSWHDGVKNNLVYWDRETRSDESFVQLFVQYFATSEKRYKWQVDLNELKQQPSERVDLNQLPKLYIVQMFLGGLKAKTTAWLSIADLDSLEDAIQGAHKIEAGEYYNKKGERDKAHDSEVT
ncbi:11446_t:CDS:2 [Cetraspora pellucida]|uniref:11446_t:CDS:1 n=1 Tax=Cetraspora pellucida TaxID=1433469 RepID=A0ACA9LLY3_9GLOM|nr:11446_t:CDS:2 [Cetraspora pellucida]